MQTIQATLAAIRNIDGMNATFSRDWQEYRVTFANDKGNEDAAYYTNDADDAFNTALAMYHRKDMA